MVENPLVVTWRFFKAAARAYLYLVIESICDEASCSWSIDFLNFDAAIRCDGRSSAKTAFEKFDGV
jgi:hypothetical protein